jgi:hypothetical protein
MLVSGALDNLLPKVLKETLVLEVTRPYKDLFSFDSRKVQCIGLIKDLVVTMAQIPRKCVMMDAVVTNVPSNYGMLSSRCWGAKLGENIRLDLTFATISVYGGETCGLYRLYFKLSWKSK